MIEYDNDTTLRKYNAALNNERKNIAIYNSRINELNQDIKELSDLRIMVVRVDSSLSGVASSVIGTVSRLPSIMINPFSVLNMNFFSKITNVVKGKDYINANNSIKSSLKKIDKKIQECYQEIAELKGKITRSNQNILKTRTQKNLYVMNKAKKSK